MGAPPPARILPHAMAEGAGGRGPGPGLGSALCIVTGASRGFGRSVARLLAPRLAPGSALLLVARSAGALGELQAQLRAAWPALRAHALAADLASEEGLQRVVQAGRGLAAAAAAEEEGGRRRRLQRLLLVNNAGNIPKEEGPSGLVLSPPLAGATLAAAPAANAGPGVRAELRSSRIVPLLGITHRRGPSSEPRGPWQPVPHRRGARPFTGVALCASCLTTTLQGSLKGFPNCRQGKRLS